jgi:formylglycine-generating enzyme
MAPPGPPPGKGMAWVPGGTFRMGSAGFYPEERPVHQVTVDGFWIDAHPVTNAEFRRFVKATGHVTVAERPPDPADYPDADPALLVPGSLVFRRSSGPVDLRDWRNWWAWVPGACWRHPEGPGSTLHGRDRHPVVQVAYEDAAAYAAWAGKALPTEAEWEFAARGGLDGKVFCWGDELAPKGRMMANTWQGEFPWQNLLADRYEGTSPVGAFPPNGYGLLDMAGNVWEWTADHFTPRHPDGVERPCCVPRNPQVTAPVLAEPIPRRVIKGGSHLCAPSYCLRYRPAARQGEAVDTATGHLGFRCVVRDPTGCVKALHGQRDRGHPPPGARRRDQPGHDGAARQGHRRAVLLSRITLFG